eukprot:TRINITY_DN10351_c0_g1_i1.p1 TRINITY_DN10351_c0_g1~~TRINITY_DN10351_c0_g1_i1.p1  ORF type:complete len:311 (+),score=80.62 TRINITY_DN10351_c0_g1_i1:99-935(+)
MVADKSELLAEAVPESLKNILLVMTASGIFQPGVLTWGQDIWTLSWTEINSFCPSLKDDVNLNLMLPKADPQNAPVPSNEASKESENQVNPNTNVDASQQQNNPSAQTIQINVEANNNQNSSNSPNTQNIYHTVYNLGGNGLESNSPPIAKNTPSPSHSHSPYSSPSHTPETYHYNTFRPISPPQNNPLNSVSLMPARPHSQPESPTTHYSPTFNTFNTTSLPITPTLSYSPLNNKNFKKPTSLKIQQSKKTLNTETTTNQNPKQNQIITSTNYFLMF